MEYSTGTNTTHKVTLGREEIIEFLRSKGKYVTDDARVYIPVPGGGDWSNTNLDLDQDSQVEVTWKVSTLDIKE